MKLVWWVFGRTPRSQSTARGEGCWWGIHPPPPVAIDLFVAKLVGGIRGKWKLRIQLAPCLSQLGYRFAGLLFVLLLSV